MTESEDRAMSPDLIDRAALLRRWENLQAIIATSNVRSATPMDVIRLIDAAPRAATERPPLTVAEVVGWARFSAEDIRTALKHLRGPVDRDESLVMAAADLFASMMERVTPTSAPEPGS